MLELFNKVSPFLLTYLGAFSLYLLSRNKGIQPFSLFYAINVPVGKRAKPHILLLDCFLTSLIGSGLAYALVDPITNAQSVTAGLSFTGIINSISTKNE
jgi:hypothetical protein